MIVLCHYYLILKFILINLSYRYSSIYEKLDIMIILILKLTPSLTLHPYHSLQLMSMYPYHNVLINLSSECVQQRVKKKMKTMKLWIG